MKTVGILSVGLAMAGTASAFAGIVSLSPGESGDDAVAIEEAIAAAAEGDKVVELAAGTYTIMSDVDLTVGVTLRGATGNPEDVILRWGGGDQHRVLAISSADAMVCGLTVENANNNVKNSNGGGIDIAGTGGTVSNCVIRNCIKRNYNHGGGGIAIEKTATRALVTHCVVSNCYESGTYTLGGYCGGGGALMMYAGTVRNCLFVRNVCATSPSVADSFYGTVLVDGGSLENCTVANNSAGRCAGIWAKSGTVVNCIVADNVTTGSSDPNYPVWAGVAACFTNCVSDGETPINEFCEVVKSPFVDARLDDWRLAPGTAAVDTGAPLAWMSGSADLAGNDRVRGVGPDIGCLEIDPVAFGAHLALSADSGLSPVLVVCTVDVANAGGRGVRYEWDWDGDGDYEDETDVPYAEYAYEAFGDHVLGLRVTDVESEVAYVTAPRAVTVYPRTHYVSKAEGVVPTAPYATPETAAPDIATALAVASPGGEIVVASDTYTISSAIALDKGVCIRGETGHPEDVVLHSDGASHRVLDVSSGDAIVCGLTIENANNGAKSVSGGGVYISGDGGTVSNCIVRNCQKTNFTQGGGGIFIEQNVANALVTHCVISNCSAHGSYTGGSTGWLCGGGALTMYSGTVRNCLFVRNTCTQSPTVVDSFYGTVRVDGGVLENCTVANNSAGRCAGVWARGGTIVNCLIANNQTLVDTGADLPVWAGEASCFTNCVSDGATAINETCETVAKDPFANAAGGDWQLAPGISEVTDKGVVLDWMTEGATDIYGNPRVRGDGPDIGAHECDPISFAAGFVMSADRGFLPAKVVCTVTPVGGGEEGTLCEWDWDGDGNYEERRETLVAEHTFTAYGQHAVSVRVTDKASGQRATPSARVFTVYPKTLYVGKGDGVTPQAPYASEETAAPDIATALAAATAESEIIVAPDTYVLSSAVVDEKGVTIRGKTGRPEDVILQSDGGKGHRVLELRAAKSVVCGVTVENGKYNTRGEIGSGVYVSGAEAVLSNCLVRNCVWTQNHGNGGGGIGIDKLAEEAIVTHCVVSNCQELGSCNSGFEAYMAGGGALAMFAGSVRNCLFVGNVRTTATGDAGCRYGTVRVAGGVLENCTLANNGAGSCAGVWVSNPAGQVVNCLILGNETTVETDANLPVWAGEAESFARCVGEVKVNGDCRTSTATETYCNMSAGDYRLKKDSPAVDYGLLRGWMTDGALDLCGRSRRSGRFPDVGAYECRQSGLALLVR